MHKISKETLRSFEKNFDIEYAHNSAAIEGNTLSLIQTKAVLEDGISVGGKTLRELYEIVNHNRAFDYMKKCIADRKPPVPSEMYGQIKDFYADMQYKYTEDVIKLAAWIHAEFVKIHPFAEMIAELENERLDEYLRIMKDR